MVQSSVISIRRTLAQAALCIGVTLGLVPSPAQAGVVERVVAIVGEQPILLTELRQRARPFLYRIYANVPPDQIKVAEGEMFKELLGKLVDERVVATAADKLSVTVSTREVDEAVKLKAQDMKYTIAGLLAEAAKQGLSEADYREEVRRELLFGKMLETRVRSRVRPTEDDAREYYYRLVGAERRTQTYRASMIALDLNAGVATRAIRKLAEDIVKSARSGTDFATLAKRHSVDPSRDKGGDLGTRTATSFGKTADAAVLRLDVGQVSEPILVGSQLVIIKITERPPTTIPPFADVKEKALALVRDEMLQKQIKVWLDELKTGVYIDIRL